MRTALSIIAGITFCCQVLAQETPPRPMVPATTYQATPTIVNDLVHTRLDVQFDYARQYMYGKAWITLKPHFYKTDSVTLDAKGMSIDKVAIMKNGVPSNLAYRYDSMQLFINLDKAYTRNDKYTLFIQYTARPNEYGGKGSAAITDAKGLYFINPLGTDSTKPTEIWTQGETEASSVWFPTIDKPNQKTTQEISMTVPAKYVTLSNGKLVSQRPNKNGTRTDTWKMDLPHAPYLFFMGVGDFAIVKDTYKGKEVSYYVEKPFAGVARRIFGATPEMMQYFSSKLNYEYPWVKYAQMTGRDYVSGAMENTTATLHSDYLQQNARQLSDGNKYEDYISHELFHQWFGDLVTAESWSNLTVNESFANYSEVLWREYKHGQDDADAHNYADLRAYLSNGDPTKQLVRFHYRDKEDMFDLISYHKGGRILHMLRQHVGDEAFFKSLNLYLKTHQFKNAEAHQLRLAFEEVTGQDLNWFFNQWYFGAGHPILNITYGYDSLKKEAIVYLKQAQTEQVFKLPMAIDVYEGEKKTRYRVWTDKAEDTLRFAAAVKPVLINIDAEKTLLAEKNDVKGLEAYRVQFERAGNYVDRREALDYAMRNLDKPGAEALVKKALTDAYFELRQQALAIVATQANTLDKQTIAIIEQIAKKDPKRVVRAAAIEVLGELRNPAYRSLFFNNIHDSSYSVAGAALNAFSKLDEDAAVQLLPELKKDAKGDLEQTISVLDVLTKGDADFDELTAEYDSTSNYEKLLAYEWYLRYLGRVNNTANFKSGLDRIIKFRNLVGGFDKRYSDRINEQLRALIDRKKAIRTLQNAADMDEQVSYIEKSLK